MNWNLENTTNIGVNVSILLDGIVQKHCVEADTDEGFVVRYQMLDDGHFAINGDDLVTEKVTGVVSVVVVGQNHHFADPGKAGTDMARLMHGDDAAILQRTAPCSE